MSRPGGLSPLVRIKLLHTVIWAVLAAGIVALPALALAGHLRWALALSAIVLIECAVIGLNKGKCPLTAMAARYTDDRADNFDIYLPLWLARYNKWIFGLLFLGGEITLVWCWLM
jgi:hypothetical protein